MTWEDFRGAALEKGFAEAYAVSAEPFSRWRELAEQSPDPRWARLCADPAALVPGARAVIVLAWAYQPYSAFPEGTVALDAYYPASQQAYLAARELAALLAADGRAADVSQALPAKWALLRTGEAHFGRSGVVSLGRWGTRVCIQTIVTNAPFSAVDRTPDEALDPRCARCRACLVSCPTAAHEPSGRVSTERCLRAQPFAEPVPERYRPLLGASLLGCDLCQRPCPRNAAVSETEPPAELVGVLRLESLLAGDVKPLAGFIGANYARPARVQGRAALLAANLGRTDALPLLERLRDTHAMSYVREHARWAIARLREGTP